MGLLKLVKRPKTHKVRAHEDVYHGEDHLGYIIKNDVEWFFISSTTKLKSRRNKTKSGIQKAIIDQLIDLGVTELNSRSRHA